MSVERLFTSGACVVAQVPPELLPLDPPELLPELLPEPPPDPLPLPLPELLPDPPELPPEPPPLPELPPLLDPELPPLLDPELPSVVASLAPPSDATVRSWNPHRSAQPTIRAAAAATARKKRAPVMALRYARAAALVECGLSRSTRPTACCYMRPAPDSRCSTTCRSNLKATRSNPDNRSLGGRYCR